MTSTDKLVAAWFLIRSLVAEIRKKYGRALALQERATARIKLDSFWTARKIGLLISNGQIAEARPLFGVLGEAPPTVDPTDAYVRVCAQMWSAFLEGDLIGADAYFAQLQTVDQPRQSVRKWLLAERRPSIISAESLLKNLGAQATDPLEFLNELTGAHVLLAFEAYVEKRYEDALQQLSDAAEVRPLTSAQQTLESVCLLNAGRTDEADRLFTDVAADLSSRNDLDDVYLRLFCQLYRSSEDAADRAAIREQAVALEPRAALRNFFPIGEEEDATQTFDAEAVRSHFSAIHATYRWRSPALTPGGSP